MSESLRQYNTVTTYTSDRPGSGTDANVSIVVKGAHGDTGRLLLAKGKDDFIRGQRDQFVLHGEGAEARYKLTLGA